METEDGMVVNWQAFVERIDRHQRFLLTSHIRPDCDALGSELGLALVLETLGKDVWIVNGHETPPNLAFLDPGQRIQAIGVDVTAAELEEVDALIVLDTSAWAQLGPMGDVIRSLDIPKLLVDHHVGEDDLGAEIFKSTTSEATGRLVVEAADALEVALTEEMATPLFAALATDTGWFRFSSTRPSTYQIAARLTAAGARPDWIYGQLYEQETLGRVRLRGRILSRLEDEFGGRLVHSFVQSDDYQQSGALPSDTEDAINLSLAVAGTEFAVIVVEQVAGGCKVSFRSRSQLDCSAIARHFGGGGHQKAAGAFVDRPLKDARELVLKHVRTVMDRTLEVKGSRK